ncbi:MAG: type II toxin-antitoxin system MqsA family antitoxin [Candidatus Hatepunaea meridiana]|nr:type II toxin-antitoxin system MqsA family antitoxin [Candidatus Hatepunaea meridiana]
MICEFCGKEGARVRRITESLGKGAKLLVIEDVPMIFCPNCGQSYLTAETAHQIDAFRRSRKKLEKRSVDVARFDLR